MSTTANSNGSSRRNGGGSILSGVSSFFRRPPMAPSSQKKKKGTSQTIMNINNRHLSRSSSTLSTVRRTLRRSRSNRSRSSGSINKPRGTNSLFRAISAENWELVVELCDVKPYKAESWHSAPGFFDAHRSSTILPLHQACVFHPPKVAISRLIRAYPHGTMSKESGYGRLPLHIACHSSACMEAIRVLLMQCPSSSYVQDNLGRVPLHYALSNGSTIELVRELLISASEAAGEQGLVGCASAADFNGWVPLHVACHMCASIEVIRLLVQAFPAGTEAMTKKGSTPLALVRGLSVPEPRRLLMEAVLLRTEIDPPVDDLKRRPEDGGPLENIGSVTVADSKEMRLDLDGDASSLSSFDDVSTIMSSVSKNFSIDKGKDRKNYLPTHRAYSQLENGGSKSNRSVATAPSDGYALGAGHVVVRQQSLNRMGSMVSSEIGLQNSSSSSSKNDDDDADAVSHSFQSVTPAAVFC